MIEGADRPANTPFGYSSTPPRAHAATGMHSPAAANLVGKLKSEEARSRAGLFG
jgi:hypothetical protein